jgi:ribosomal protein S18 acetylase RimI-like enzyme
VNWTVRRLNRKDFDAYLAIRLEALRDHPEAYATSPEAFLSLSRDEIEAFLSRQALFGIETEAGALAGIVVYQRETNEREAHRGWLLQVYVKSELRGTGAALAMMETAIEHARGEVLQLHLAVGVHNDPAIRLYQKAGFEIYGTDPRCLLVNGRYIDEHLMVRFLDKAPGDQND